MNGNGHHRPAPRVSLPPHNREAERWLLGGILRDPDVLHAVLAVLDTADLYMDAHQRLLRVIHELAAEGSPVDLVLVWERLRLRRWLADVGRDYLVELWQAIPGGANAVYHAGIVRDCAIARHLIHAANEVLRDAQDRVAPGDELAAEAVRRFAEVRDKYGRRE